MIDQTALIIAQNAVRAFRNEKLADTDWAVLPDSPLSEEVKGYYRTYRQYLRDYPASLSDTDFMTFKGEGEIPDFNTWFASLPA